MTTLIKEQRIAPRKKQGRRKSPRRTAVPELVSEDFRGLRARAERILMDAPGVPALQSQHTSRRNALPFWLQLQNRVTPGQTIPLIAALYFSLIVFMVLSTNTTWETWFSPRPEVIELGSGVISEQVLKRYSAFVGDQNLPGVSTDSVDASQFLALKVGEYRIQPGDTLSEIALKFGLNMDTLISFNQIGDVRRMQIGKTLRIPNRDGLSYTVRTGDSLSSIATAKGTTVNALLDANDLKDATIVPGMNLFIPNVRMDEVDLKLALGELFILPTRGYYSSPFGYRADPFTGQRRFHNGLDIANDQGTPVWASIAGRVVHIESQVGNYGKFIIIQHPRGFKTLYAHLDSFSVKVGQYISQGQVIGRMGNTGRSTGSHLHFSVFKDNIPVDPMGYLH